MSQTEDSVFDYDHIKKLSPPIYDFNESRMPGLYVDGSKESESNYEWVLPGSTV